MSRRIAEVASLLLLPLVILTSCGSSDRGTITCDNGIVVFDDVPCSAVELDVANLPPQVAAEIATLRTEAQADPSKALPNAQKIQRIMASLPFEVCSVMQTNPESEFLTTEAIAPIAAELAATTCPLADTVD